MESRWRARYFGHRPSHGMAQGDPGKIWERWHRWSCGSSARPRWVGENEKELTEEMAKPRRPRHRDRWKHTNLAWDCAIALRSRRLMQPRPTGVVPGSIWLEIGRVHQVRTEGAAAA